MSKFPLSAACTTLWLLAGAGCATDAPTTADEQAVEAAGAPVAHAPVGTITGTRAAGVDEFRGIPYAQAPVGDLRWKPPVALEHVGQLTADHFQPHCAQPTSPFGVASTSEDCLFLNVFAPPRAHAHRHPVMVWIHGGALITGESDDYDPTRMVTEGDVVVVTINYRLGALGFLAHPALTAESPDRASGNYGLMDQQEALRWVQRNIEAFGGDPARVTIFGESAGGLSVHAQLASDNHDRLFQRAIVESGAYQLDTPSLALAEAGGARFATAAGCADQSAACLRTLSVAQILASQNNGLGGANPVVDGKFLARSIRSAFTTGHHVHVPTLEGSNHDEWRLFQAQTLLTVGPTSPANYPAAAAALAASTVASGASPISTADLLARYPLAHFASPDDALAAIGTDAIFACNARVAADLIAGRHAESNRTFVYEFDDPNAPERFLPPIPGFPYRAAHASELQYLFDLPATVPTPALTADQQALAHAMVGLWTTFARTGEVPHFPGTGLKLAPPHPVLATFASFERDHNCDAWSETPR